jgi:hypothetical protein
MGKYSKYSYLRQEMVAFPIFLLVVEGFRRLVMFYFPETPLFDPLSELETGIVKIWQFTWMSMACWLLLWIIFPKVHKFLVHILNDGFGEISIKERLYASLIIYAIFFFGLIFLFNGTRAASINECSALKKHSETELRKDIVASLKGQLHVRELTGNNDGVEVEKYLAHVGFKKGASWCAAFCAWNLSQFCVVNPMSAWSPDWARVKDRVKDYLPGDCFTLFYSNLGRVGHVGFITGESHGYYTTIEGNTGLSGSREGSGVHTYFRDKRKVYAVTNYISRLYS